MIQFSRCLIVWPLLSGASRTNGQTATDDTHIDTDTDVSCDAFSRSAFEANSLGSLCTFYDTCPGGGLFANESECRQAVTRAFNMGGRWDPCLAQECTAWLSTEPTCTTEDGFTIDACENMYPNSQ